MTDETQDRGNAEFERRSQEAFRASVDDLDAATLSRLNQARQKALASTRARGSFGSRWLSWAPAGALAAGVLAAVLLLRAPSATDPQVSVANSGSGDTQQDSFELLAAGEDLELATEADLDFYAWVELEIADDGVS